MSGGGERVVVVASPGARLYVRRGTVYVAPRDGEPVPVTPDVELVVLAVGAVSVSGRALRRLAELGVRLVVLGQRGQVVGEYRPLDRVNRTIASRMAQYQAKVEGWGLLYAAEMVLSKIFNQARVLRYLARSRRDAWLREESYRVDDAAGRVEKLLERGGLTAEALRSAEAAAARIYWSLYATLLPGETGFRGRDPLGDDPVNKALSYGYAILYSYAHDALVVAGLDPYAGFLHSDRSGRESLVYDYSDMFKPVAVDKVVAVLGDSVFDLVGGSLSYAARRELARAVVENMGQGYTDAYGRRRRLRDHVYSYAWGLASSLRGRTAYRGFRVRL